VTYSLYNTPTLYFETIFSVNTNYHWEASHNHTNISHWIMCTKGIHGQVLNNTLHPPLIWHLDQHLMDMQMNMWKVIYLNCRKRYGDMIDHHSYTHNLSSGCRQNLDPVRFLFCSFTDQDSKWLYNTRAHLFIVNMIP